MGKRTPAGSSNASSHSKFNRSSHTGLQSSKPNPFDMIKSKQKHQVANVKQKSTNIAKSRSKSIDKRMETLGVEMAQRNRTSVVVDKRFGEHDNSMSIEDKMLVRFQRTRQKQLLNSRKSAFNLASDEEDNTLFDDDDEPIFLTHKGRKIDDMYAEDDDGDEFQKVSSKSSFHFGDGNEDLAYGDSGSDGGMDDRIDDSGNEGEFGGMTLKKSRSDMEIDEKVAEIEARSQPPKTKAEVMAEVIQKSKMHKNQAKKELEQRRDMTEQLNENFDELRQILGLEKKQVSEIHKQQKMAMKDQSNDDDDESEGDDESIGDEVEMENGKSDGEFSDFDNLSSSQSESSSSDDGSNINSDIESNNENEGNENQMEKSGEMDVDPFDFDAMVERLSKPGIRKAKPTDALLTEEHIAKAERARLIQLEKQRLARMNAHLDEKNEEGDDGTLDSDTIGKSKNNPNHLSSANGGTSTIPNEATSKASSSFRHRADDLDDEFSAQFLPQHSDDSEDENGDSDGEFEEDGENSSDDSEDEHQALKPQKKKPKQSIDEEDEMDHVLDDESRQADKQAEEEEPDYSIPVEPLPLTGELPYTLRMPFNFEQFQTLLEDQSAERQAIIIARLRACHHVSLHPSNRSKLENLVKFLFQRVIYLGNLLDNMDRSSSKRGKGDGNRLEPLDETSFMNQLEILLRPLYEISQQHLSNVSSEESRKLIWEFEKELRKLKTSRGPICPSFALIFFTQFSSHIWSFTDRRHQVISPLLIHIGHFLASLKLVSTFQVLKSLLFSNVALSITSLESKRYTSETVNFLFFVLVSFLHQNGWKDNEDKHPKFSEQFLTSNPMLSIKDGILKISKMVHTTDTSSSKEANDGKNNKKRSAKSKNNNQSNSSSSTSTFAKPSLSSMIDINNDDYTNETSNNKQEGLENQRRMQILFSTVSILHQLLSCFSSEIYASELFSNALNLLQQIPAFDLDENSDGNSLNSISSLKLQINQSVSRTIEYSKKILSKFGSTLRVPLQQFLKSRSSEPLPGLTPDFAETYYGDGTKKNMTEDRVARELQKAKRKLKSEQKGAEKELRKDTRFIQHQKLLARGEQSQSKVTKNNYYLSMLQGQQADMNKEAKKREKRKSKK